MKYLHINKLLENDITDRLFPVDSSFETLLKSIGSYGIKEPLIVKDEHNGLYTIISGIRRYRAAKKLGIKKVPISISHDNVISKDLILTHQVQRIKTNSQIIRELKFIKKRYNLSQGVRSDLHETARVGRSLKKLLEKKFNKTKIDRLTQIEKLAKAYSDGDDTKYDNIMERLDQSDNVSGTLKHVKSLVTNKINNESNLCVVRDLIQSDYKVYCKSSIDLSDLEDKSVQTIVTSPPYWDMIDYGLGNNQLGKEPVFEDFVNNLVTHFNECKRVLKDRGSMFVNLSSKIEDGHYKDLGALFGFKMEKNGWIWTDKIIWIKNNSQYTHGKRSSNCNEDILHFVKQQDYDYSTEWVEDSNCVPNEFTVGYGENRKFKSVLDSRITSIRSNTSNNNWLKKACEERGIVNTHSATFPTCIPLMGILCTSRPGDLVLDIFNGTGTTGQVAIENGRAYVGYDLNSTYIAITKVRLDVTMNRLSIAA